MKNLISTDRILSDGEGRGIEEVFPGPLKIAEKRRRVAIYPSASAKIFVPERFDNPSGHKGCASSRWLEGYPPGEDTRASALATSYLHRFRVLYSTRSSLRRDFQDDTPQATRSIRYLFGYAPGHGGKTSVLRARTHTHTHTRHYQMVSCTICINSAFSFRRSFNISYERWNVSGVHSSVSALVTYSIVTLDERLSNDRLPHS